MAYERARVTMDDPLPSPVHYKVMLTYVPPYNQIECIHLSTLSSISQSILKKTVTMHQAPSAVYHYTDSRGSSDVPPSKVGAIFQAAKKDLLRIIQLQVSGWGSYITPILFLCTKHTSLLNLIVSFLYICIISFFYVAGKCDYRGEKDALTHLCLPLQSCH